MKFRLALAAFAALAAAVVLFGNDYALTFTIQLFVFVVLAYAWNIIGGYTGYSHFGQMSFFGIGAYVGMLLMLHLKWHWLGAALAAGGAGLALAVPLGWIMLRLKGPFFAISLFGLTRVFEAVSFEWDALTGGGTGLYLPPINDQRMLYLALALLCLGMLMLTHWIDNSRFGLQLQAIRDDEGAAEALGIRTTRLKVTAFSLSAVPVLLGGLGTILGPAIGAVTFAVLNELLWSRFPDLYYGLVGLVVIACVLFMPRGIVSLLVRSGLIAPGRGAFRRIAARSGRAP
ncbi:MAG: branched-chain amino acid ABC transporter permease [Proteobacteria bacterium]|nr:branched-chain amino acid ABC transporter permease [Pseudomonadota bacterium]